MRRQLALSQAEIEGLESAYPQIEDVLPLAPLQEGLLFHALYDAQAPDIYTVQLDLGLEGALDSAAMAAAVQALVARHASLRARFRHAHLGRPVQVILPQATAPWRCIDLSSLDEAGREERLAADRHRLVLTNHHIVMDGWSMPVLVRELLTLYAHRADAAALPRVTPYRDYLAWAAAQDRTGALAAWRDALAGLEEATRLAPHDPGREPGTPLLELLRQVQASQSRLMEHQHLGLAEVQGLAGLGELFDTLVVFENYPVDRAGLSAEVGGLRLTDFRGLDATHYPLSLAAHPGERLQLQLSYRPDLFDRSSVEAIAGRLVRLLEGAVADPERAIGRLDILGADERHTILREWNATARAVPGATLPELFAAQVARTPEADAVVFEDERLSYGELDARSSQLAHHLRGLGVGPEVVVGLCIERSLAMLVGLLGILKAGGAYLPLDPDYPPERLAFMLADAGAPVLLTRAALRAHLPAHDTQQVVCLDADWPIIARQPTTAPRVALHPTAAPVTGLAPQHPAYVIYTSGSTGTPKGVAVTHQNVVRLFGTTEHLFHFGTLDVWTLFHSFTFDFSVWEIWGALLHGGRLVVVPYAISRSPPEFLKLMAREGVTVLNQTPSAF